MFTSFQLSNFLIFLSVIQQTTNLYTRPMNDRYMNKSLKYVDSNILTEGDKNDWKATANQGDKYIVEVINTELDDDVTLLLQRYNGSVDDEFEVSDDDELIEKERRALIIFFEENFKLNDPNLNDSYSNMTLNTTNTIEDKRKPKIDIYIPKNTMFSCGRLKKDVKHCTKAADSVNKEMCRKYHCTRKKKREVKGFLSRLYVDDNY